MTFCTREGQVIEPFGALASVCGQLPLSQEIEPVALEMPFMWQLPLLQDASPVTTAPVMSQFPFEQLTRTARKTAKLGRKRAKKATRDLTVA